MNRPQLEHVIRAAASITGATEIVVMGSQAILGQFPEAPLDLLASIEADVFTLRSPADAELIEGSIGEGSPFHQTFGYYGAGSPSRARISAGRNSGRLIPDEIRECFARIRHRQVKRGRLRRDADETQLADWT